LRREHRRPPRTEADADYVKAKTEMVQIKIEENKRTLVRQTEVDELIDGICGLTLTHLNSWPVRHAGCRPRSATEGRSRVARAAHRDSEIRVQVGERTT
jgi:hypothetical protein